MQQERNIYTFKKIYIYIYHGILKKMQVFLFCIETVEKVFYAFWVIIRIFIFSYFCDLNGKNVRYA